MKQAKVLSDKELKKVIRISLMRLTGTAERNRAMVLLTLLLRYCVLAKLASLRVSDVCC